MPRIAVVTGSNKGLGLAIVELLCRNKPNWIVYLTARDEGRGLAAVKQLNEKGLKLEFHLLDIDDVSSVETFRDFLLSKHGGLDVLVNNAAIGFSASSPEPFSEQAYITCRTNYFNLWNTCDILYPILRPHSRVVSISSFSGHLALSRCSDELKSRFLSQDLTRGQLDTLINEFICSTKAGTHTADGWPSNALGVAKMGVTCMTIIQQRLLDSDSRADIVVNACCPGAEISTDYHPVIRIPNFVFDMGKKMKFSRFRPKVL